MCVCVYSECIYTYIYIYIYICTHIQIFSHIYAYIHFMYMLYVHISRKRLMLGSLLQGHQGCEHFEEAYICCFFLLLYVALWRFAICLGGSSVTKAQDRENAQILHWALSPYIYKHVWLKDIACSGFSMARQKSRRGTNRWWSDIVLVTNRVSAGHLDIWTTNPCQIAKICVAYHDGWLTHGHQQ